MPQRLCEYTVDLLRTRQGTIPVCAYQDDDDDEEEEEEEDD